MEPLNPLISLLEDPRSWGRGRCHAGTSQYLDILGLAQDPSLDSKRRGGGKGSMNKEQVQDCAIVGKYTVHGSVMLFHTP